MRALRCVVIIIIDSVKMGTENDTDAFDLWSNRAGWSVWGVPPELTGREMIVTAVLDGAPDNGQLDRHAQTRTAHGIPNALIIDIMRIGIQGGSTIMSLLRDLSIAANSSGSGNGIGGTHTSRGRKRMKARKRALSASQTSRMRVSHRARILCTASHALGNYTGASVRCAESRSRVS